MIPKCYDGNFLENFLLFCHKIAHPQIYLANHSKVMDLFHKYAT